MNEPDDEFEEDFTCPECDGSGVDPAYDPDVGDEDVGPDDPCPVCCGFGRMDW